MRSLGAVRDEALIERTLDFAMSVSNCWILIQKYYVVTDFFEVTNFWNATYTCNKERNKCTVCKCTETNSVA